MGLKNNRRFRLDEEKRKSVHSTFVHDETLKISDFGFIFQNFKKGGEKNKTKMFIFLSKRIDIPKIKSEITLMEYGSRMDCIFLLSLSLSLSLFFSKNACSPQQHAYIPFSSGGGEDGMLKVLKLETASNASDVRGVAAP